MEDKNSANDIFRIVAWIAGTMMVLAIAMCGVGSGGGPRATAAMPMAIAIGTTGGFDTTPPTLQSATIDGDLLSLTYDEQLGSYESHGTEFSVSVTTSDGITSQATPNGIGVDGSTFLVWLTSPVQFGDGPITLSYTPVDGSILIQDVSGNPADPLSNQAVTNLTGATTLTGTTASTASITTDSSGDVSITMPSGSRSDLTISSQVACPNGATPSNVGLVHNSKSYAMTGPDASGQYTGTIPGSELTNGDITIAFECAGEPISDKIGTIQLYDPSGIISDAVSGQPVVGAKVTLYKVPGWEPETDCETMDTRDSTGGPGWDQPAPTELGMVADPNSGEISPRLNPQHTNSIGYYGWDVARGCWYVTVEKAGYEKLTSPVVGVPPAVLDLDLKLTPQYELKGFYSPVDMGGTKNTAKAGATIPLKFEVFHGGTELTDTSVVKSIGYKASSACGTTTAADAIETLTDTTGLRYVTSSGQFVYGWKTPKSPGCYDVTAMMTDGSHLTALFDLK